MTPNRKSYSYHDQDPGTGKAGKGWVVVEETLDEHGDVEDTDLIAFYKTEDAARKHTERLNAETR